MKRRALVLSGAALACSAQTIPLTAFAQGGPAEAATIKAVVKAAIAIAQSIASSQKDDAWRQDLSRSIRRIEVKVDQLLAEVRNLAVQINEELNRRYIAEAQADFVAMESRLNAITESSGNRQLNRRERTEIETMLIEPKDGLLDRLVSVSAFRDPQSRPLFAAFPTVLFGFGLAALAARSVDFPQRRLGPVARSIAKNLLQSCIDPRVAGSYGWAAAETESARINVLAYLSERGDGKEWTVSALERPSVSVDAAPDYWYTSALFSGSSSAGYSYVLRRLIRPPYPPTFAFDGNRRYALPREPSILADRIRDILNGEVNRLRSLNEKKEILSEAIAGIKRTAEDLDSFATAVGA